MSDKVNDRASLRGSPTAADGPERASSETQIAPFATSASGGKRYWVWCVDEVSGMEFDFELDSKSRREAIEEAHSKYNGVRSIESRPKSANHRL